MSDSGQNSEDWITISRLVHTQGNRGELFGEILTDFPERFDSLQKVFLSKPSGLVYPQQVEYTRWHKKGVVFKLSGVNTIAEAEDWVGSRVVLARKDLSSLAEGTFYHFDLEGCQAFGEAGQRLGVVLRIDDFGGNQLLVIQPEQGQGGEYWVPFSRDHVLQVECEYKRITLRVPEELEYLNSGN